MLIPELTQQLNAGKLLYGFSKIEDGAFAARFRTALIIALPYQRQLTLESYREPLFEETVCEARNYLQELLTSLAERCEKHGVSYEIPPAPQTDEIQLRAVFGYKSAAVKAGLGWIGRNDALITKEYGPRVRLTAILLDCDAPYGTPVTQSSCPPDCRRCVNACPHHALTGELWMPGTERRARIDYQLCNQQRSRFLEKHGRKNACGLCMAACPFGSNGL